MDNHWIALVPNAPFRFSCNPEVACFNECCRDLNQFLTPYDVLRLKRRLGMSSQCFLRRYTRCHTGPDSGLPVITLTPGDPERLTCPFVTPQGCRVYPDRPSSCRIYPVVRILRRSRQTGTTLEEYMLLREPHCRGFEQTRTQTVREWMADQQILDYNAENNRLLEVIGLKNRLRPGRLPSETLNLVYTALYDLDSFRQKLLDASLPGSEALRADFTAASVDDDLQLLHLGLEWVRRLLEKAFGR